MEKIDSHNENIRKLVKLLYLDDIKRDKTKDEREISFNIREVDNEIVFAREIPGKEVEFFKIDKENLEVFGKFQAIIDEEGNEVLHEVLFTFDSEDFGKSYVLVYPAGIPEGEEVELQAFSYVEAEDGTEGQLNPIETEAEWDMIEEVLNTFLAEEDL